MTTRFVQTQILNIAYEDHGHAEGFPVVLLHGFPYDVRSWDQVLPSLVNEGYHVFVPYLRGYGLTTFLHEDSPRVAQQAAIAQDVVDFARTLRIDRLAIAGFDWGNRAACIASILHPELVACQVAIGGYAVQNTLKGSAVSAPEVEARLWYQWYFNTEQGRAGLEENRRDIIRYLWKTWSPNWKYTDEVFNRSAPSFDNPDFVDVAIHSYRHRHVNAPGEDRFIKVEKHLSNQPPILVPSIVLRGMDSGFGTPEMDLESDRFHFPNLLESKVISGAGHDLPVQRPLEVSSALIDLINQL